MDVDGSDKADPDGGAIPPTSTKLPLLQGPWGWNRFDGWLRVFWRFGGIRRYRIKRAVANDNRAQVAVAA